MCAHVEIEFEINNTHTSFFLHVVANVCCLNNFNCTFFFFSPNILFQHTIKGNNYIIIHNHKESKRSPGQMSRL